MNYLTHNLMYHGNLLRPFKYVQFAHANCLCNVNKNSAGFKSFKLVYS